MITFMCDPQVQGIPDELSPPLPSHHFLSPQRPSATIPHHRNHPCSLQAPQALSSFTSQLWLGQKRQDHLQCHSTH